MIRVFETEKLPLLKFYVLQTSKNTIILKKPILKVYVNRKTS